MKAKIFKENRNLESYLDSDTELEEDYSAQGNEIGIVNEVNKDLIYETIEKEFKNLDPKLNVTPETILILKSFLLDAGKRITDQAMDLAEIRGKTEIKVHDVVTALKIALPNQLGNNLIKRVPFKI